MALISCKVFLTLIWSKNCVLTRNTYRKAVLAQGGNAAVAGINNPTNANLKQLKQNRMYQLLVFQLKIIANY